MLAQRPVVRGQDVAGQRPAVHRVDPGRLDLLDAVDGGAHGILVGEDADTAVHLEHRVRQVLGHDRRLVAGLEVQV